MCFVISSQGFGKAYLWLGLRAAVIDAKLLYLTVGERGGGCLRRHGGVGVDGTLCTVCIDRHCGVCKERLDLVDGGEDWDG